MAIVDTRRILKADAIRNLGTRVVFNYDDLTKQCEEKIAAVKQQAEEILTSAIQEAEELRQQAHEVGYQAGYEEGAVKVEYISNLRAEKLAEEQFQKRLEQTLPVFERVTAALNEQREQWLSHWETAAVRLAATIAMKVLQNAVALQPDLCEVTAREALKLAVGKTQVTLRMNPEDIQCLGERVEKLANSLNWTGPLPVIADSTIGRGGCVVQSEHGEVDARLETQVERIVHELLN